MKGKINLIVVALISAASLFVGCQKDELTASQDQEKVFKNVKIIKSYTIGTDIPYDILSLAGINLNSFINDSNIDENFVYENAFEVSEQDGATMCYGIIITKDTNKLEEWIEREEEEGKVVIVFPVFINDHFSFAIGISYKRRENNEPNND